MSNEEVDSYPSPGPAGPADPGMASDSPLAHTPLSFKCKIYGDDLHSPCSGTTDDGSERLCECWCHAKRNSVMTAIEAAVVVDEVFRQARNWAMSSPQTAELSRDWDARGLVWGTVAAFGSAAILAVVVVWVLYSLGIVMPNP